MFRKILIANRGEIAVQTGEHWTRHWKRARLVWELKQEKGGNR